MLRTVVSRLYRKYDAREPARGTPNRAHREAVNPGRHHNNRGERAGGGGCSDGRPVRFQCTQSDHGAQQALGPLEPTSAPRKRSQQVPQRIECSDATTTWPAPKRRGDERAEATERDGLLVFRTFARVRVQHRLWHGRLEGRPPTPWLSTLTGVGRLSQRHACEREQQQGRQCRRAACTELSSS